MEEGHEGRCAVLESTMGGGGGAFRGEGKKGEKKTVGKGNGKKRRGGQGRTSVLKSRSSLPTSVVGNKK